MRLKHWFLIALVLISGCSSSVRSSSLPILLARLAREGGEPVIRFETIETNIAAKKVTLTGDSYHFGLQWGLLARETGTTMLKAGKDPAVRDLNRAIVAMYREIDPSFLEICRGIAKAYQVPFEELDMQYLERDFFFNSGWNLFDYSSVQKGDFSAAPECSMAAVRTVILGFTNVIIGRNFDYTYNFPRFTVLKKQKGVYTSAANALYALDQRVEDGVNEKGLCVGILTVEAPQEAVQLGYQKYPDHPAVEAHHLLRILLNTCATVSEAKDLINKISVWFPDEFQHFMIADRDEAVVLEYTAEGKPLFLPMSSDTLLLCNTYLSGDPASITNDKRFLKGSELLQKQTPSNPDEMFKNIMGPLIQPSQDPDKPVTVWCSVYNLLNQTMNIRFVDDGFQSVFKIKAD